MARATPRSTQIALIADDLNRSTFLAQEIDGLEAHMARIEKRIGQLLGVAVGILVSTVTTSITLILAGIAT